MKNPRLLTTLALAAMPALAHANHATIQDVGGTVSPLTLRISLTESVGGYARTDAARSADEARGVTYPSLLTYYTTYFPDSPRSAILNPFGWDTAKGNNYVERITTRATDPQAPVVTAEGSFAYSNSRYSNAELLADLAASGKIPAAAGYRIVAVKFDLDHEVHYTTTAGHTTHVNDRLYFFAEKGADDPAPVFLGAEYEDIYIFDRVIGLDRVTTIRSGRYTETYTGNPVEGGFDFRQTALNLNAQSAGEFTFVRPAPGNNYYIIRVGGVLRWTERLDTRSGEINHGPLNGNGLTGPAQGYFPPSETDEHTHPDPIPNAGNQAVATGSVNLGALVRSASLAKYLNVLPPVHPH